MKEIGKEKMKSEEMKSEEIKPEEIDRAVVNRRTFLTRMAATGMGVAALGVAQAVQAASMPKQPAADTGHNYPMAAPHAMTEKQFRMGVIGPATLSHMVSEMAVDRATNPSTREFANFELREAIAVLAVLKNLGTPTPPMDANSKATLAKIESSQGAAFDKAYITAQLANHEFLRDLAAGYLNNSAGHTSIAEMHGRNLATLALGTFKEHVVHCKTISAELQG